MQIYAWVFIHDTIGHNESLSSGFIIMYYPINGVLAIWWQNILSRNAFVILLTVDQSITVLWHQVKICCDDIISTFDLCPHSISGVGGWVLVIFHPLCWGVVCYAWGTTPVCLGITYVCCILIRFLSLEEDQTTNKKYFHECPKYYLTVIIKFIKKRHTHF